MMPSNKTNQKEIMVMAKITDNMEKLADGVEEGYK